MIKLFLHNDLGIPFLPFLALRTAHFFPVSFPLCWTAGQPWTRCTPFVRLPFFCNNPGQ